MSNMSDTHISHDPQNSDFIVCDILLRSESFCNMRNSRSSYRVERSVEVCRKANCATHRNATELFSTIEATPRPRGMDGHGFLLLYPGAEDSFRA